MCRNCLLIGFAASIAQYKTNNLTALSQNSLPLETVTLTKDYVHLFTCTSEVAIKQIYKWASRHISASASKYEMTDELLCQVTSMQAIKLSKQHSKHKKQIDTSWEKMT